jgi:hypothetical protein
MLSTISYRTEPTRSAASHGAGREAASRISARHHLLRGSSRTASVQELERAIGRFAADRDFNNRCDVALFEIEGDEYLHCNVTHRHVTKSVAGWAGPGHVPDGFVHNRRFRDTRQKDVIRCIRDMVCAARV